MGHPDPTGSDNNMHVIGTPSHLMVPPTCKSDPIQDTQRALNQLNIWQQKWKRGSHTNSEKITPTPGLSIMHTIYIN